MAQQIVPHPGNPISTEEAIALLDVIPDYDPGGGPGPCVHTFRSFIGAHWYVEDLCALIDRVGAHKLTSPVMGHGIAIYEAGRTPLLVATVRPEVTP